MQRVNLTRSQRSTLEMLNKKPGAWYDYYDVMRNGGSSNALVLLVNQGLAVKKDGSDRFREWKITEAGQKALVNGQFTKTT